VNDRNKPQARSVTVGIVSTGLCYLHSHALFCATERKEKEKSMSTGLKGIRALF